MQGVGVPGLGGRLAPAVAAAPAHGQEGKGKNTKTEGRELTQKALSGGFPLRHAFLEALPWRIEVGVGKVLARRFEMGLEN